MSNEIMSKAQARFFLNFTFDFFLELNSGPFEPLVLLPCSQARASWRRLSRRAVGHQGSVTPPPPPFFPSGENR